jgi:hypothetical protein
MLVSMISAIYVQQFCAIGYASKSCDELSPDSAGLQKMHLYLHPDKLNRLKSLNFSIAPLTQTKWFHDAFCIRPGSLISISF